jgi:hypothetical protein
MYVCVYQLLNIHTEIYTTEPLMPEVNALQAGISMCTLCWYKSPAVDKFLAK